MAAANLKTFELKYPFEYKSKEYTEIAVRRPKVRDLKTFIKDAEGNAVAAIERAIANLAEIDEKVITEMDLEDFAPIKSWFEGFLKLISDASEA